MQFFDYNKTYLTRTTFMNSKSVIVCPCSHSCFLEETIYSVRYMIFKNSIDLPDKILCMADCRFRFRF